MEMQARTFRLDTPHHKHAITRERTVSKTESQRMVGLLHDWRLLGRKRAPGGQTSSTWCGCVVCTALQPREAAGTDLALGPGDALSRWAHHSKQGGDGPSS